MQAAEGNRGGSGVGNKMPEEKIGGEIMGRRNNTRTPKLTNFGDSFSFLRGKKRKTQPFEKFMLLPGPIEGTVLIPGGGEVDLEKIGNDKIGTGKFWPPRLKMARKYLAHPTKSTLKKMAHFLDQLNSKRKTA